MGEGVVRTGPGDNTHEEEGRCCTSYKSAFEYEFVFAVPKPLKLVSGARVEVLGKDLTTSPFVWTDLVRCSVEQSN